MYCTFCNNDHYGSWFDQSCVNVILDLWNMSRFNILLVSRDYRTLKRKSQLVYTYSYITKSNRDGDLSAHTVLPSKDYSIAYADLIVDQCTGMVVQPLSLLSSDAGVHTLSSRAAALSLQYEKLWIILYVQSEDRYRVHTSHCSDGYISIHTCI